MGMRRQEVRDANSIVLHIGAMKESGKEATELHATGAGRKVGA